jgi:hypothetical protein
MTDAFYCWLYSGRQNFFFFSYFHLFEKWGKNDNQKPYSLICPKKDEWRRTQRVPVGRPIWKMNRKEKEKHSKYFTEQNSDGFPEIFAFRSAKPGTRTPYCRITFSMILLVLVAIKVKHVSLCIIFKWSTILLFVASRNVKTGRRSPRPSPGLWKKSTSLRCDCPMCTNDFYSLVKGANKK